MEIKYKKKRTNNSFELPIQFLDQNSKEQNIYIPNVKNNNQNEKNKYNNNSIDEDDKKNNSREDDFIVFEHEDFLKAFFGDKNK